KQHESAEPTADRHSAAGHAAAIFDVPASGATSPLHGKTLQWSLNIVSSAMDLGLNDRVAIVTGSSKGLGFASARALIAEGCRVVICARTPDPLQEARRRLAEIAPDDDVFAVVADVSQEDGVRLVVGRAGEKFGGRAVLIHKDGHG